MLRIKKRHTALKGMVAGSVAFAIGLTGTAALIGNSYKPEPFTFNKEQSTNTTPKEAVPIKTEDSSSDTPGAASEGSTASATELTQPATSTWAPAPRPAAPAPLSASTSTTTSVTAAPPASSTVTTTTTGTTDDGSTSGGSNSGTTSVLGPATDALNGTLQGATCTLLGC